MMGHYYAEMYPEKCEDKNGVTYVPKEAGQKHKPLWNTTYKCGELEISGHIEGLYTWDEAMALELPEGWRVASDYDWFKIEHYFDNDAQKIIKNLGIVLAGYRGTDGTFYGRGSIAIFWAASGAGANAWARYLNSGYATVGRYASGKAHGFSVRCVKDI